jgi:hypothetical protein
MRKPDLDDGAAFCAAILFSFGAAASAAVFFDHPFDPVTNKDAPECGRECRTVLPVRRSPRSSISMPDKEQP